MFETWTETITDTTDKAGLADVVLSMLQDKDPKWKEFPDDQFRKPNSMFTCIYNKIYH
jgi:hypothetical protein